MPAFTFQNDQQALYYDRWWFNLWIGWGAVCALLVGGLDRSLAGGLFWLSSGLLLGRFGWLALMELDSFLERMRNRFFPEQDYPFSDLQTESYLAVLTDTTLNILNPKRMDWEVYPFIVIGIGIYYGVLVGGVFGALFPVCYDWQMSAFDGALWGVGIGSLFFCLFIAVLLPIIMYLHSRGPSVESLRPILKAAAEDAERRGHAYLVAGHLLLEILKHPSGSVKTLLVKHARDEQALEDFLLSEMEQELLMENILEESPVISETLNLAIKEAKDLQHPEVESGHLLLGLLESWPAGTRQAIQLLGIDPEGAREEILAHL